MRRLALFASAAAVMVAAAAPLARACDINVREAGYITNSGAPYGPRSYVIWFLCPKETPEAKAGAARVDRLVAGELSVCNLAGEVLGLEGLSAEERKDIEKRGIDPGKVPGCAVGRPGMDGAEILQVTSGTLDDAAVKALVLCPQKVALGKLLEDPGNYCVVLFSPGKDAKASEAALAVVKDTLKEHAAGQPNQKIPILTIDRSAPADAFFMAELGIKAENEAPYAGVIFGLGCLLQPTFTGAEITKEALASHLDFLNHNASDCGADPVFVREATVDLLMRWDPERVDKIAEELAKAAAEELARSMFGPDNPPDGTDPQTQPPTQPVPQANKKSLGPLPLALAVVAGVLVIAAVGVWLALRGRQPPA